MSAAPSQNAEKKMEMDNEPAFVVSRKEYKLAKHYLRTSDLPEDKRRLLVSLIEHYEESEESDSDSDTESESESEISDNDTDSEVSDTEPEDVEAMDVENGPCQNFDTPKIPVVNRRAALLRCRQRMPLF